jgi:hypothetical protein
MALKRLAALAALAMLGPLLVPQTAFAAKSKPDIAFNLAGRTFTSAERVKMSGDVDPATHSEPVTLHVQRYDKADERWRNYDRNVVKSDVDGSFSYKHPPLRKGKYRARAEVGRTSDHRAGRNSWKQYAVRRRNF